MSGAGGGGRHLQGAVHGEEAGRGGGSRVCSRVLEHQQLTVRLLREQELWGRVTVSRSWRDAEDPPFQDALAKVSSASPFLSGKNKGPKSPEGWNGGLLSSLPA